MKVSNIKYKPIIGWDKWHVWFVSFVVDNLFKINNVAVFSRLNSEKLRLVFPEKKVWEKKIKVFFPITDSVYFEIEDAVNAAVGEQAKWL